MIKYLFNFQNLTISSSKTALSYPDNSCKKLFVFNDNFGALTNYLEGKNFKYTDNQDYNFDIQLNNESFNFLKK